MGCQCAKESPAHDDAQGKGNSVYAQPPPVLYHLDPSPPSRAALLAARQIGLDVEIRRVNLMSGEHLSESFLKMNPQHCLPTLDDNGFVLWESRAISTYLVSRYGREDSLYPKDPKQRAVVDRRLYFDACTLYASVLNIAGPIIMQTETTVSDEKKKRVADAIVLLNGFLAESPFVSGDTLTVADLAILASVTSIQSLGFDVSRYSHLVAWLGRCESQVKGFAENAEASKGYGGLVQSLHQGGGPVFT